MLQKTKYTLFGIFLAALGLWGLAVTIPNSFSSGDVVSASKMNQNFQALKAAVNQMEGKLTDLETTMTALQAEQDGLPTRQGFPRAYVYVDTDGTVLDQFSTTGATISANNPSTGKYNIDFGDEDIDGADPVSLVSELPARSCTAYPQLDGTLRVECRSVTDGSFVGNRFWVVLFNDGS